jgi:hypothetical protein
MEIQHRPGKKHANADALSRIPLKTNALCLSNYLDSLDTFPSKSMSRFPRRDPDLRHPRSHFFFLLISRSKYYWINREVFVLEKGVLWREGDEGKSARRVVPKMYREQIVKLCHDPPLAGHQGIERTIELSKEDSKFLP